MAATVERFAAAARKGFWLMLYCAQQKGPEIADATGNNGLLIAADEVLLWCAWQWLCRPIPAPVMYAPARLPVVDPDAALSYERRRTERVKVLNRRDRLRWRQESGELVPAALLAHWYEGRRTEVCVGLRNFFAFRYRELLMTMSREELRAALPVLVARELAALAGARSKQVRPWLVEPDESLPREIVKGRQAALARLEQAFCEALTRPLTES